MQAVNLQLYKIETISLQRQSSLIGLFKRTNHGNFLACIAVDIASIQALSANKSRLITL